MPDKMIDPETAERIKDLFLPKSDTLTRVVLWPWRKVYEIIETLKEEEDAHLKVIQYCQRSLAHFVCCDDYVRILMIRPRNLKTGYLVAVDDFLTPYDLTPESEISIVCRFLLGDDRSIKYCNEWSVQNQKNIAAGKVDVFRLGDYDLLSNDDKAAFSMGRVLEHYAFSPYTTIRERPTIKQALRSPSRNPLDREWPAIQVVNLRIAKRPERSEPTGRKIEIRYPVAEHMRRQPTKAGIKLIKIREHWRGPEAGPVKPKTKKVYKVVK
jgi:hypothetical protein